MPNIGDETTGASSINTEDILRGIPVTMPEDGDISSITARLGESTTANAHTVKAAIYRTSDGALLGESATRSDIASGSFSAYAFTVSPAVSVTNGTGIIIAVISAVAAGNLLIEYDAGSSGDGKNAGNTGLTLADPETFSDDANQYSIYATYTATGADPEGSLIGGKLLRGGLLMHGVLGR